MNIATPDIYWEDGHLLSSRFNDVYSSRADALAETRYVFLDQSGFAQAATDSERCVVAETGFGTGLNFLAAWQYWRGASPNGTLHFISVEKFPLAPVDIKRALSAWPELAEYVEAMMQQYPVRRAGMYRLYFDAGRVQLTLCFGDVEECLLGLIASVDFWFLDGFAPRQNESMWSKTVIQEIARLSHRGTGLSTFTAVGAVRRLLIEHGFAMRKVSGFGKKREMLRGVFEGREHKPIMHPCFCLPKEQKSIKRVAIIGAGLAGTSTAYVLAQAGIACTIYDEQGIAQAASGNALGIAAPCLSADEEPFAQFYFAAWQAALRSWCLDDRFRDAVHVCGTKHYAIDVAEKKRAQRLIEQCCHVDAWAHLSDDQNTLEIPKVLLVSPVDLCQTYMHSSGAEFIQEQVHGISQTPDASWSVHTTNNSTTYDALIIANAQAAMDFPQCQHLNLQSVRGQLAYCKEAICEDSSIQQQDLYLTPFHNGKQVLGATFQRDDHELDVRESDQAALLAQAQQVFPLQLNNKTIHGRVSFRSCGPDRMPVVGPVIDVTDFNQRFADLRHGRTWQSYDDAQYMPGLYLSVGHGSRGITGSLLAAQINRACLLGEPLPIAAKTWQAIASQRFCYRQLRRA